MIQVLINDGFYTRTQIPDIVVSFTTHVIKIYGYKIGENSKIFEEKF